MATPQFDRAFDVRTRLRWRWCGGVPVLFFAMLIAVAPLEAQVAAVTELRANIAAVDVHNPSTQAMTVEIRLHHGEVVDGKLVLGDVVDAIVGPREFRLEAGDRQTVRVLVREEIEMGTVLRLVTTLTPTREPSSNRQGGSRIVLATRLITKLVASE